MAAPMAQGESNLGGRFHRDFQDALKTLEQQIGRLSTTVEGERSEAVDQCLAGIDRLSHDVKDASGYLAAYDQRTYSQHIKGVSEKLQAVRNTFNPPKKFSFKNRRNAPTASNAHAALSGQQYSLVNPNPSSAPKPSPNEHKSPAEPCKPPKPKEADNIPPGPGIHRPSFPHASQISISHHTNLHLILPPSASHATSSGTLSNLQHSVIDLSPATTSSPFSALYLKNISASLLICGHVAGAAHITGVTDSVLVITTRQFRMHASRNVVVYLHAASRPIIEDCVDVRFAPLPGVFAGEGVDGKMNMWDRIDDFKWLKAEPSPNFRVLGEGERIGGEVWGSVVAGGEDGDEGGRERILRAVGVLV